MGKKSARLYNSLRTAFQEQGDHEALEKAQALLREQQNISLGDRERLLGFLEGGGKMILAEPQALLTPASKMPGLDGQKMSKSYDNTITLREPLEQIAKKISTMPTDPARVRLTDPGDPNKCPVWQLHEVYSDESTREWVNAGCRSAGIGCLECKKPLSDAIVAELEPIQLRAVQYEKDPDVVRSIIAEGCEAARETARESRRRARIVALDDDAPFFLPALLEKSAPDAFPSSFNRLLPFLFSSLKKRDTLSRFRFRRNTLWRLWPLRWARPTRL